MVVYRSTEYTVYRTPTLRCACFLIRHGDKYVLWDTGMKHELRAVRRTIRTASGRQGGRLDAVFLSHAHSDHAANAQALSELYGCPVYVSEKGMDRLRRGSCPVPEGTNAVGRAVHRLSSALAFIYDFRKIAPCPGARELTVDAVEGYLGANASLISVSGHSDDSTALALDGEICLTGDAFVNVLWGFYPPFADFPDNIADDWRRLAGTGCSGFYPGHGIRVSRKKLLRKTEKLPRGNVHPRSGGTSSQKEDQP